MKKKLMQIVNKYPGKAFNYKKEGIVCVIPKDTEKVLFEYYVGFDEGRLYLREKGGEAVGDEVIKYNCNDLRKIEKVYKNSLEQKPEESVEERIVPQDLEEEYSLEQVLDYDINRLDITAERINNKKLVSKEAVDFLVKKNLDVLAYDKRSSKISSKKCSEMRYLCDLLSKAKIGVIDSLTKETKIIGYNPSDVLQEEKYRKIWAKHMGIVKEFNLQTT